MSYEFHHFEAQSLSTPMQNDALKLANSRIQIQIQIQIVARMPIIESTPFGQFDNVFMCFRVCCMLHLAILLREYQNLAIVFHEVSNLT
jgi:hypothetical protein